MGNTKKHISPIDRALNDRLNQTINLGGLPPRKTSKSLGRPNYCAPTKSSSSRNSNNRDSSNNNSRLSNRSSSTGTASPNFTNNYSTKKTSHNSGTTTSSSGHFTNSSHRREYSIGRPVLSRNGTSDIIEGTFTLKTATTLSNGGSKTSFGGSSLSKSRTSSRADSRNDSR